MRLSGTGSIGIGAVSDLQLATAKSAQVPCTPLSSCRRRESLPALTRRCEHPDTQRGAFRRRGRRSPSLKLPRRHRASSIEKPHAVDEAGPRSPRESSALRPSSRMSRCPPSSFDCSPCNRAAQTTGLAFRFFKGARSFEPLNRRRRAPRWRRRPPGSRSGHAAPEGSGRRRCLGRTRSRDTDTR